MEASEEPTYVAKLSQTGANGSNITEDHAPTLDETSGRLAVLTSSAEASRSCAKTSPSPAPDEDSSTESDPPSSSSSPESLTLFSEPEAGSSLRTFPDFFPPTVDEISPSYSRRWPSSGFTTGPGECWTADTSECPSDGAASSSLPDVLEADVPARFYLSPRAAAGILRRAEKRGRELPPALAEALAALASAHQDDGKKTTPTSSTPSPRPAAEPEGATDSMIERSTAAESRSSTPSTAKAEEPTTTTPRQDTLSPTPSEQRASTPPRTGQGAVRRLSPTECERLQGFPDGWTWVPSTSEAERKAQKPSRTTSQASEPQAADQAEATSTGAAT